jgi:hypothetical protein
MHTYIPTYKHTYTHTHTYKQTIHTYVQGCYERWGMYGHTDDLQRFALLSWAALEVGLDHQNKKTVLSIVLVNSKYTRALTFFFLHPGPVRR